MKKIILSLAAAGLLAGVSTQAIAGPVSGAVIGATSGAVSAGSDLRPIELLDTD